MGNRLQQCKGSSEEESQRLLEYVRRNVIGKDAIFKGPFGDKKVIYCDYVASGKPLVFIEDYIRDHVLPFYANTHTTTSLSGLQTTHFRHEAREIIKKCLNTTEEDVVIFTGSGATSAIHKLIHALEVKDEEAKNTTVIVGPYEHHSNILPWKESGAETERIKETFDGTVDLEDLERRLKIHQDGGRRVIVAISAASNVTGIKTNTVAAAELCHKYGALSLWDYAAGAPYLKIDMNPSECGYKDAVFISPHKFVGGPGTPGILVAKKKLFQNTVPGGCGGGTVVFVTHESHLYTNDIEEREEGGTPAIVACIRAGLTFQLKEEIGPEYIETIEEKLCRKAFNAWKKNRNIKILGDHNSPRIPIFSFLVTHAESGKLLHHNFVAAVLNDVYGIQARGGCACAGPYAQDLLSMDEDVALQFAWFLKGREKSENGILQMEEPLEIMKPGFARLNLPYFFDEEEVDYVIKSVDHMAENCWKLLPQYTYEPRHGSWRHKNQPSGPRIGSLWDVTYKNGLETDKDYDVKASGKISLKEMWKKAKETVDDAPNVCKELKVQDDELPLPADMKDLVWFLLPSAAKIYLEHPSVTLMPMKNKPLPYAPRNLKLDRAKQNWKKLNPVEHEDKSSANGNA